MHVFQQYIPHAEEFEHIATISPVAAYDENICLPEAICLGIEKEEPGFFTSVTTTLRSFFSTSSDNADSGSAFSPKVNDAHVDSDLRAQKMWGWSAAKRM